MSRPFAFIEPCLPTLRPAPPTGDAFIHECKFDGHRIQIHKRGREDRLYIRNGHSCTKLFAGIAAEVDALRAREVILDGVLVASDGDDRPDFDGLTLRRAAPDTSKCGRSICCGSMGRI